MHALIIEDEPMIAILIEAQLRDLGFCSFDITGDQAQAVAYAREHCPDLITADDKLTSGSGTDAVRRICSEHRVPVVFITGDHVAKQQVNASYLEKPFLTDELKVAVLSALGTETVG